MASIWLAVFVRRVAPSTVTKLGQKPLRQEKSLLQDDRLICRLRPNGVSFGSDAQAIGLDRAVAAAFANEIVDIGEALGVGHLPALAPPPLLGGAGLLIDEHGDA